MSEYIIEFSKTGTICFTSHLDMMRIFKRVFKRTGVTLAYSQGYNPHPKMGFAQPLSLGYWGMKEYFECETAGEWENDQLLQRLAKGMPEGIELKRCLNAEHLVKTLASHTVAAEYMIAIPEIPISGRSESGDSGETKEGSPRPGEAAVEPDPDADLSDPVSLWHSYMDLAEIPVWKRQKKKKEPKKINIRPMIREITFTPMPSPAAGRDGESGMAAAERSGHRDTSQNVSGSLYVDAVLDCGSDSNLSPELIISSVCRRFGISTDRSEISVMRKEIFFDRPLEQLLEPASK